jgi:hypothetical protein
VVGNQICVNGWDPRARPRPQPGALKAIVRQRKVGLFGIKTPRNYSM